MVDDVNCPLCNTRVHAVRDCNSPRAVCLFVVPRRYHRIFSSCPLMSSFYEICKIKAI